MKRILITGENNYIGLNQRRWLLKSHNQYHVDLISLRDNAWKSHDFSQYDVVYHVAGMVHVKETPENRALFFIINRDLSYEVALKAKQEKVRHFIFLSSMSVYCSALEYIDSNTPIEPDTNYGRSKAEAEILIESLRDPTFLVSILRLPIVYGAGCKGNYARLEQFAKDTPVFPLIDNQRSMIYIDNLSEFVKTIIDHQKDGLFFPQNKEYVSTSKLVHLIAKSYGKQVILTRLFNIILKNINFTTFRKLFGNHVYDKTLSDYEYDYHVSTFEESILQIRAILKEQENETVDGGQE